MNIQFLKDEKDAVKIQLENEDTTFGNALKDELWNTKGVEVATLNKNHPLVGKPELLVQGKDARKLLKTAAQNLKKNVEEFEKLALKEL